MQATPAWPLQPAMSCSESRGSWANASVGRRAVARGYWLNAASGGGWVTPLARRASVHGLRLAAQPGSQACFKGRGAVNTKQVKEAPRASYCNDMETMVSPLNREGSRLLMQSRRAAAIRENFYILQPKEVPRSRSGGAKVFHHTGPHQRQYCKAERRLGFPRWL